ALLIWTAPRCVPYPSFRLPGIDLVVVLLVVIGAGVAGLGGASFRRARPPANPMHPGQASALVVGGLSRGTPPPRCPGFTCSLLAWVVYLTAWPALLVLAAFIAYMNQFQIKPEERALEARFGAAFVEYKRSVRRWL